METIVESINIGGIYEINGEDYTITIKPSNSNIIQNSTYVNFSNCEEILRKQYNISSGQILTFLQIELDNENEKSLVNQVEYQAYDDKKKLLDLSHCDNSNIKIYYNIKDNIVNLSKIKFYSENNIDIFNIQDSFLMIFVINTPFQIMILY